MTLECALCGVPRTSERRLVHPCRQCDRVVHEDCLYTERVASNDRTRLRRCPACHTPYKVRDTVSGTILIEPRASGFLHVLYCMVMSSLLVALGRQWLTAVELTLGLGDAVLPFHVGTWLMVKLLSMGLIEMVSGIKKVGSDLLVTPGGDMAPVYKYTVLLFPGDMRWTFVLFETAIAWSALVWINMLILRVLDILTIWTTQARMNYAHRFHLVGHPVRETAQ